MLIKILDYDFSICQISDLSAIEGQYQAPLFFLARTEEEISLVCPTPYVPSQTIAREHGWKALKIEGTLDFSLVGILARISGLLASRNISIFAVSTFNTDYVLVKSEALEQAVSVLEQNGYAFV